MQKKINYLKIETLIVTLIQLLFAGVFLTLYLFNVWDMNSYILPEYIAYTFSGIIIVDCFYVWRIIFAVSRLKQESDVKTSDIIGSDIQEAYTFGQLGFCVTNEEGMVLWVSDLFTQREINIVNENIYLWCPKLRDFVEKDIGDKMHVTIEGFDYEVKYLRNAGLFIFKDNTDYQNLTKRKTEEAVCIGIINIDNYNEITTSREDSQEAIAKVKVEIQEYAKKRGVLLRALRNDSYFAVCPYSSLCLMEQDEFNILDKIRSIDFHEDIRPTLSIGFSHEFPDINKLNEMASNALEIAMSRGGDQAVVSNFGSELKFFGGKTEAVEKRNKVKVRIFANSLISLIRRSSNVIIMGHTDTDMDAIGSCLGIKALCNYVDPNKDSRIVYEPKMAERKVRTMMASQFSKDELNELVVSPKDAPDETKPTTLIIVCDVSVPAITMCPKALENTEKVVVIDHHRRSENFIDNAVLSQVEPSASSACELVAELIKYNSEPNKIPVDSRTATIMLSGIFLDTGFYKSKTVGLRTFEASMILKDYGGDNALADDFLKDEYEEYTLVNKIVDTMKTPYYGIVYCQCDENEVYERSTLAKAANACMQLKGVNACFVIGKTAENVIHCSARSDGLINVQIICERLGGGGHFSMAAAKFENVSIKDVEEKLLDALNSSLSAARGNK